MPAAKGLDCGVFNTSKSCGCGRTYSKAMACIMVLWQASNVEDAADLRDELALCEGPVIVIDEERTWAVSSGGNKTQDCSYWAEAGPRAAQNYV